jgi:hypothetical protein
MGRLIWQEFVGDPVNDAPQQSPAGQLLQNRSHGKADGKDAVVH